MCSSDLKRREKKDQSRLGVNALTEDGSAVCPNAQRTDEQDASGDPCAGNPLCRDKQRERREEGAEDPDAETARPSSFEPRALGIAEMDQENDVRNERETRYG